MFLAAVLRAGTEQAPVKVRNMSPNGAMIETSVTPVTGSQVELIRGALIARGSVIWTSANKCGVRFSSEVSVKDWLAAPDKSQQQRVDDIVALVKAGGLIPVGTNALTQKSAFHPMRISKAGSLSSSSVCFA